MFGNWVEEFVIWKYLRRIASGALPDRVKTMFIYIRDRISFEITFLAFISNRIVAKYLPFLVFRKRSIGESFFLDGCSHRQRQSRNYHTYTLFSRELEIIWFVLTKNGDRCENMNEKKKKYRKIFQIHSFHENQIMICTFLNSLNNQEDCFFHDKKICKIYV